MMTADGQFHRVHFVGVSGIGLSRIAKYFLLQGKKVSGSDLVKNSITDSLVKHGLTFSQDHKPENLPTDAELLVYSYAIPETSPERVEAKRREITQLSHFEVLGKISEGFRTIAVAGTNGKSTTTALIGLILEAAGLDPTVFIGSQVKAWDGNLRVGKSEFLVVEADELGRQFLNLRPYAVVLTNIEPDHLDYFQDLNDIWNAYRELLAKIPANGFFVFNKDDDGCKAVGDFYKHQHIISYGRESGSVKLVASQTAQQRQSVQIKIRGRSRSFTLRVPGLFNVYNALAAVAVGTKMEIPFRSAKRFWKIIMGFGADSNDSVRLPENR